ncbi:hypothetical protein BABINDRAFT_162118 [Babjeviella inositovora NRRL Y-12698]|uniref:Mediator of RNA polymerase II transcription subunit 31 n=1 Tax=Babjeviella inositovora NRRL Y-12698 TaxID=984486 RepID=A0A1E3QMV0_9ASCO|nr:uncharacterized protein BABINDRAFT_162118 [Babjeviella inositovora NRRL Y-12698]ODQ79046.1 hypothetical protein BABINDRAFT_162118 [Babjeviella inositovora NRRL Y-12698]
MADPLPTRWEIELEFVQALANIQYLNFLAQNKYLSDPQFLSYLKYLEYWRHPDYAKFLVYPNCLHILTLLQNEEFRTQILRADVAGAIMNDMVNRWQEPSSVFSALTPVDDLSGKTEKGDEEAEAPSNGTVLPTVSVNSPV